MGLHEFYGPTKLLKSFHLEKLIKIFHKSDVTSSAAQKILRNLGQRVGFLQLRKSNKFIENSNSAVKKSTNVYRSERSISICVLVIYVSA